MPTPKDGESEKEFMARCIPQLIDEGKEQDQAVAICYSLYEQESKKEKYTMVRRDPSGYWEGLLGK